MRLNATNGPSEPHRAQASSQRRHPLGGQQLPVEPGEEQGRVLFLQAAERADRHPVELRRRFPVLGHLVHRLQDGGGLPQAVEVLAHPAVVLEGVGLGHDVELAPLVELQADVAGRLEPAAETAFGLAHTLGHRPDLAVALGQDDHDAVRLAEPVCPQHDPLVAVEGHDGMTSPGPTAPNRRLRPWNSRTASNRWSRLKSGQSVSVKTSSL